MCLFTNMHITVGPRLVEHGLSASVAKQWDRRYPLADPTMTARAGTPKLGFEVRVLCYSQVLGHCVLI